MTMVLCRAFHHSLSMCTNFFFALLFQNGDQGTIHRRPSRVDATAPGFWKPDLAHSLSAARPGTTWFQKFGPEIKTSCHHQTLKFCVTVVFLAAFLDDFTLISLFPTFPVHFLWELVSRQKNMEAFATIEIYSNNRKDWLQLWPKKRPLNGSATWRLHRTRCWHSRPRSQHQRTASAASLASGQLPSPHPKRTILFPQLCF